MFKLPLIKLFRWGDKGLWGHYCSSGEYAEEGKGKEQASQGKDLADCNAAIREERQLRRNINDRHL